MAKAGRKFTPHIKRRRRQIHRLELPSLAVGLPVLGSPTIGQQHALAAKSLETSSPESMPIPKRVHCLEAGDSTLPVKARQGRRRLFAAAELQKLQDQLFIAKRQQRITNKQAIKWVKDLLPPNHKALVGHDRAIEHQIVRPVQERLRTLKRRK